MGGWLAEKLLEKLVSSSKKTLTRGNNGHFLGYLERSALKENVIGKMPEKMLGGAAD